MNGRTRTGPRAEAAGFATLAGRAYGLVQEVAYTPFTGAFRATDHGGLLSHSAIVARENGIPAVVGTGGATAASRDGDLVTVSGTGGRVSSAS